jgi:hypothetical protein
MYALCRSERDHVLGYPCAACVLSARRVMGRRGWWWGRWSRGRTAPPWGPRLRAAGQRIRSASPSSAPCTPRGQTTQHTQTQARPHAHTGKHSLTHGQHTHQAGAPCKGAGLADRGCCAGGGPGRLHGLVLLCIGVAVRVRTQAQHMLVTRARVSAELWGWGQGAAGGQ